LFCNLGRNVEKTKLDERGSNLILIGGTSVNKITKEIIPYLPIQYVPTGRYGGLYSRLSYEIYPSCPSRKVATLQVIPNHFTGSAKERIIIAFGLESTGTKAAVQALMLLSGELLDRPEEFDKLDQSLLEKENCKNELKNKTKSEYTAKVLVENERKNSGRFIFGNTD
jgi:S-layer family protein